MRDKLRGNFRKIVLNLMKAPLVDEYKLNIIPVQFTLRCNCMRLFTN